MYRFGLEERFHFLHVTIRPIYNYGLEVIIILFHVCHQVNQILVMTDRFHAMINFKCCIINITRVDHLPFQMIIIDAKNNAPTFIPMRSVGSAI